MKREDWEKVEVLVMSGRGAKLRINDHIVTLSLERTKMKLSVCAYVNGQIKGAWCISGNDSEESMFMYHSERYASTKKQRDSWAACVKKYGLNRMQKQWPEFDPKKKFTVMSPWFPSVSKVRSQYEKTFNLIELVEE